MPKKKVPQTPTKDALPSPTSNKIKILALDVATHCGWAVSAEIFGVWDFTVKKDESAGMRLIRFRSKVTEMIQVHGINLVVFERTSGMHKSSIIVQAELHGVLKVILEDSKIDYRAFSASEIKKFATGKGNSNKLAMVKAAKEKYNYQGNDDNEADALHLLKLTESFYK